MDNMRWVLDVNIYNHCIMQSSPVFFEHSGLLVDLLSYSKWIQINTNLVKTIYDIYIGTSYIHQMHKQIYLILVFNQWLLILKPIL